MSSVPCPAQLWYLPPGVVPPDVATEGAVRRLGVTSALVHETVTALDAARSRLGELSADTIVMSVQIALDSWRKPDDIVRTALLTHGPVITGYSRPLLEHAIDVMLPKFDDIGLRSLLSAELGSYWALDEFIRHDASTRRIARGPGRQFHVLAGGVPTVGIFSLICALLLKSPVIAKPSAHDALFPALFAQTLARVEPRLAGALAVLPWPGGSVELEQAAMAGAGAVVVYGSDATVADLRRRAPAGARFVGYGHRLSVAGVGREALGDEYVEATARRLAWDVALFDQQGCLSPQVAAVERGGQVEPKAFAERVAAELAALAVTFPRGALDPAEAAQIQSLRQTAAFQAAAGADVALWQSPDSTDWTVIYRAIAAGLSTCRNRVISVVSVDDLASELPRLCAGLPISTVGLAAWGPHLPDLIAALTPLATRICHLGTMGEPPVTWRHDGQTNLGPLVSWVDVEVWWPTRDAN